jgi:hypothetical protein
MTTIVRFYVKDLEEGILVYFRAVMNICFQCIFLCVVGLNLGPYTCKVFTLSCMNWSGIYNQFNTKS